MGAETFDHLAWLKFPEGPREVEVPFTGKDGSPSGKKVKIVGRISTDPEELKRVADAVVDHQAMIEDFEIERLDSLTREIESHPRAKLATWNRGDPTPNQRSLEQLTKLFVRRGVIRAATSNEKPPQARAFDVRITLFVVGEVVFAGETSFDGCFFASAAFFEQATFAGWVSFDRAFFTGSCSFDGTRFAGAASFGSATFTHQVSFDSASFIGQAWFGATVFGSTASFDATFFASQAWFTGASFADGASFDGSSFDSEASFGGALFAGPAWFDGASFASRAWLGGISFADGAWFDAASFADQAIGDLRLCTTRQATARLQAKQQDFGCERKPVLTYATRWSWTKWVWFIREGMGWHRVRSLGKLSILNRVSLIALFIVPMLASAYIPLQAMLAKHREEDPTLKSAPAWLKLLVYTLGTDPHLSSTLALAFSAAVCVTLGLLLYQTAAPDTIKKRDEEEHVRDVEGRYPEGQPQRDDGLRRALERIEDQSKTRCNRHPSFIRHHGDLIWLPPREKIEWFKDETLPKVEDLQKIADEVRKNAGAVGDPPKAVDPKLREGFVPGAERARICIEEGARAEYWLQARQGLGWAWASLSLYSIGIGCLLVILFMQCRQVALAAWGTPQSTQIAAPNP